MIFFPGITEAAHARYFPHYTISVNRLARVNPRDLGAGEGIVDLSGYTEITRHGRYRRSVCELAGITRRWRKCGNLVAVATPDFMCEPAALARTGATIADHQRWTIENYDALVEADPEVYVLPVLQGYAPHEYARHVEAYGQRLAPGAWVGVGSVCKRNGEPRELLQVLDAIRAARPDLRLHGFGVKTTAFRLPAIRRAIHTSDSQGRNLGVRLSGGDNNDPVHVVAFVAGMRELLAADAPDPAAEVLAARAWRREVAERMVADRAPLIARRRSVRRPNHSLFDQPAEGAPC